ncbi:MAG: hypothetical protein JWM16_5041 [Verrucomicrobiales bacterium]|nr:hypothetical protein [Verrucomicrobiales bacterium]
MKTVMEEMITITPNVIEQVRARIPKGFPLQIADSILNGLKTVPESKGPFALLRRSGLACCLVWHFC